MWKLMRFLRTLGCSTALLTMLVSPVHAANCYVTSGADIQAAVNACQSTMLAPGTFTISAPIVVAQPESIIGAGIGVTVVNQTGTGDAFQITAPYVTIMGLTVTAPANSQGAILDITNSDVHIGQFRGGGGLYGALLNSPTLANVYLTEVHFDSFTSAGVYVSQAVGELWLTRVQLGSSAPNAICAVIKAGSPIWLSNDEANTCPKGGWQFVAASGATLAGINGAGLTADVIPGADAIVFDGSQALGGLITDVNIASVWASSAGGSGLYSKNTYGILTALTARNNARYGLDAENGSTRLLVNGAILNGNGAGPTFNSGGATFVSLITT